jgi:hypothetical protein
MKDVILQVLQKASRSGEPQSEVTVGGRLHDSALGAIYYARTASKSQKILKTMNLKNQNIWAVTIKNKRTTVRGLDESSILYISETKRDAKEWLNTWCALPGRKDALVAKIAWLDKKTDGRVTKRRLNEYLNEGIVGLIMCRDLKLPHIVRTREMWINNCEGLLLQDYGGLCMQKNMVDLSLREFKTIVVQVLVTMAIAQQQMRFKHHDVHLENVFISDLKGAQNAKGVDLNSAPKWQYNLKTSDGLVFTMTTEHCGRLAKLGDFGLSCVTDMQSGIRYERVDYPNLDGGEMEWGEWSSEDRGLYDAVVFLSKFFMCDEMDVCPAQNYRWAQELYKAMKTKWPEVECSNIGRPFRGQEGRSAQIVDFLKLDIFEEFHTPDEAAIVM